MRMWSDPVRPVATRTKSANGLCPRASRFRLVCKLDTLPQPRSTVPVPYIVRSRTDTEPWTTRRAPPHESTPSRARCLYPRHGDAPGDPGASVRPSISLHAPGGTRREHRPAPSAGLLHLSSRTRDKSIGSDSRAFRRPSTLYGWERERIPDDPSGPARHEGDQRGRQPPRETKRGERSARQDLAGRRHAWRNPHRTCEHGLKQRGSYPTVALAPAVEGPAATT